MGQSNIQINRKMLADLAVRDPKAFSSVVKAASSSP
jgi:ribosomal protein L20